MSAWEICRRFPLLSWMPLSSHHPTAFHGFINIQSMDHEVYIHTPNFPTTSGLMLSTDCHLTAIVTAAATELQEAKTSCKTVLDFLLQFQQICNSLGEGKNAAEPSLNKTLMDALLMHLHTIGWDRLQHVSPSFTDFTITACDSVGRTHKLALSVGLGYPLEPPTYKADLPTPLTFSYKPTEGLCCLVEAWERQIEEAQAVWQVLDELDHNALILDPQHPPPLHSTTRRIMLENHVTVQVSVSVQHPRQHPQHYQFLGPTHLTLMLHTRLTQNYEKWEPERSIVDNLDSVFGVRVVRQRVSGTEGAEDVGVECAICYCLHLQGQLPDLTCDHCFETFHPHCLFEWVRGQSDSCYSGNGITGECPSCEKFIICKIPE